MSWLDLADSANEGQSPTTALPPAAGVDMLSQGHDDRVDPTSMSKRSNSTTLASDILPIHERTFFYATEKSPSSTSKLSSLWRTTTGRRRRSTTKSPSPPTLTRVTSFANLSGYSQPDRVNSGLHNLFLGIKRRSTGESGNLRWSLGKRPISSDTRSVRGKCFSR